MTRNCIKLSLVYSKIHVPTLKKYCVMELHGVSFHAITLHHKAPSTICFNMAVTIFWDLAKKKLSWKYAVLNDI